MPAIESILDQCSGAAPLGLFPNQQSMNLHLGGLDVFSRPDACLAAPRTELLTRWLARVEQRCMMRRGVGFPAVVDPWALSRAWEGAIESGPAYIHPSEAAVLAEYCVQADRMLRQWMTRVEPGEGGAAWRRFLDWRETVEQWLGESHRFVAADLPGRVAGRLADGAMDRGELPGQLRLTGFAELTRTETVLVEALRVAGVSVGFARASAVCGSPAVHAFDSWEEELAAAAHWAKARLDEGQRRIAVVVNGLQSQAADVEAVFANVLHPETVLGFGGLAEADFHLACAQSLDRHPLVRTALLLLELAAGGARRPQPFSLISACLLAPAWAGAEAERRARAELEMKLRKAGAYRYSLADVRRQAERCGKVPRLLAAVDALARPSNMTSAARQFCDWLGQWGWPGDMPADAVSRDSLRRLGGMLERLESLEFGNPGEALAFLRRACAREPCRGAGGALSAVQVLTPELAFGQTFDSAWIANLTAEAWPGQPWQNPLLPASVRAGIPRASEEGMQAYTAHVMQGLLACADSVQCSWHRWSGETPVLPSHLLAGFVTSPGRSRGDGALWRAVLPAAEGIGDAKTHPWMRSRYLAQGCPLPAASRQAGGAGVLEFQSACPLAAYLVFRLNAGCEPVPDPFASRAYIGSLVHRALQVLYQEQEPDRPATADDADLIGEAVRRALRESRARRRLPPQILAVEFQRMVALLREWLAFEQDNWGHAPISLELGRRFEFQGMEVSLRVDRVDESRDGARFLIDYKTGRVPSLSGWALPRPTDLQLPLYALLLQGESGSAVQGVGFAQVRRAGMKFSGACGDPAFRIGGVLLVGQDRGLPAGAFADWEDLLCHWSEALQGLAGEFKAGFCGHQVHNAAALAHAGLEPLLRTRQATRWLDEVERHAGA